MKDESYSVESRARIHAALGDPARLAIIDSLVVSDASPGEFGAALGMPTNLVAHHLNVLQEAGLIARAQSEGDRRRTYIRLIPETLELLETPRPRPVGRVVFVCTRNSARSQLAAALWQHHSAIPTASAGTQPARRVHPRAVRVARRHGLTIWGAMTASVSDVLGADDFIVAVCDNAHERLSSIARSDLHWSVPDPARIDTDAAFEAAYTDIAARINRLAPILVQGDSS